MNFYKIIKNNQVIDVLEDPVWVCVNQKGITVRCDIADAAGVISSDSEIIWHIDGKPTLNRDGCEDVLVADITDEEAAELKVLLDIGANITETDNGNDVDWKEDPPAEGVIPNDETLKEVKSRCLAKLSGQCQQTIYNGIDVQLSDGSMRHFALEIEDQLNLLTLSSLVASGESVIPYHASDELCTYYSAEDITRIIETATAFKTYHTTYYNSLKNWVMAMDSIAEIGSVSYGDEVPKEYCSDILINILSSAVPEGSSEETE